MQAQVPGAPRLAQTHAVLSAVHFAEAVSGMQCFGTVGSEVSRLGEHNRQPRSAANRLGVKSSTTAG